MTADQRLALLMRSLENSGIDALIMGGHAVRYYGIDRNTIDFDVVTAVATTDELRSCLRDSGLPGLREEPVWRLRDFARFEIGRLPDGRPEWLEFWLRNHLLDPFTVLKSRSELGNYGGERLRFLSIADLIRSKETERESDWQDIARLEEVQDDRNLAALGSSPDAQLRLLAHLRSRRGMDRVIGQQLLGDADLRTRALRESAHWATQAFLLPLVPRSERPSAGLAVIVTVLAALDSVEFGSDRHFGLVEICRLAYKRRAIEVDRADKQARLAKPPTS